jgi:hypothetical protein
MSEVEDPIAQYRASLENTLAALRAGLESRRARERAVLAQPPSSRRGGHLRSVRAEIRWYERHIATWEKGLI